MAPLPKAPKGKGNPFPRSAIGLGWVGGVGGGRGEERRGEERDDCSPGVRAFGGQLRPQTEKSRDWGGGGGGGGRHTKEGFGRAMQRTARAKNLKIAPKWGGGGGGGEIFNRENDVFQR